jgi:hypothetical protein
LLAPWSVCVRPCWLQVVDFKEPKSATLLRYRQLRLRARYNPDRSECCSSTGANLSGDLIAAQTRAGRSSVVSEARYTSPMPSGWRPCGGAVVQRRAHQHAWRATPSWWRPGMPSTAVLIGPTTGAVREFKEFSAPPAYAWTPDGKIVYGVFLTDMGSELRALDVASGRVSAVAKYTTRLRIEYEIIHSIRGLRCTAAVVHHDRRQRSLECLVATRTIAVSAFGAVTIARGRGGPATLRAAVCSARSN